MEKQQSGKIKLYFMTSEIEAKRIQEHGFINRFESASQMVGLPLKFEGELFYDRPMDPKEFQRQFGLKGDAIFVVDFDYEEIKKYDKSLYFKPLSPRSFKEWHIPEKIANKHFRDKNIYAWKDFQNR